MVRARRSASSPTPCRAATFAVSSRRPRCSPTRRRPTWCCGCSPLRAPPGWSGRSSPPMAWASRAAWPAPWPSAGASEGRLPALEFVELEVLSGTADDTHALVRAMRAARCRGDCRARAATAPPGPRRRESGDVAAAAPVHRHQQRVPGDVGGDGRRHRRRAARHRPRPRRRGHPPCKALHVRAGEAHEIALVDVCVTTVAHVAAKALWQPATLRELYCTFAEPHAIGLSSIAGLLHPVARTDPHGVAVRMGPGCTVLAPVAPGVVVPVEVAEAGRWRRRHALVGASPAAPSRSTASGRSRSARPPRSRSRSGTTGRVCSMCVLPSPLRRRSGCWFANQPCRRSDESGTVPRSRRHPDRRRPRAAGRPGAGQGRRRVVRHLRHRPARVPRGADLHPAEGLAAPAHRGGDAGGDGPRVRRRGLRDRRRRHERERG